MDPGRQNLWSAVQSALDEHAVEPGALGEYALLLQERGADEAARIFPHVAAHIRDGCERCDADLRAFPFEYEPTETFGHELRRLLATALGPTARPLTAAARGAASSDVFSFQADEVSISVLVSEAHGRGLLEGFVTRGNVPTREVAGATVVLSGQDEAATYTADLDELGNFGFDVAAGMYELQVRFDDLVVVVEKLSVLHPRA